MTITKPLSEFDFLPCGVVVFDDDGAIQDVNATLAQWLSRTPASLVGKPLEELFPAGGRIFLQTHFLPLLHGSGSAEEVYFALRTGAGDDFPVLLNGSRTVAGSGTGQNVVVFMPIANRGQFEDSLLRALRSEQAHAEALAEQNEELQRVGEELQRANVAKDEFLGLVSHELRSPLAAMAGAVSLLRRRMNELDETTQQEFLEDLERESTRLLDLVEDMLIVARADLTKLVDLEPVLLQRLIPAIVARGSAASHGPAPTVVMPPDLPPVHANPGFVEQIVTNFLTNARKYGKDGSPLTISVQPTAEQTVAVTVVNDGEVLDAERVNRFFEPFFREEHAQSQRGLGLGLSVCQRLAHAQRGTIQATPRAGGGLEISLLLPVLND